MAGPSGGGGQAPVPQATGAPWMVGRLEQRNGEWAVLFPARGAGAPASEVAAFPCEDDARHLLRLLQLHALMRAQPSLRADQLPPELAAHILNDDGQCDEEVFNDLRALPLDDMVDMLRQPAVEEAAKAGTAPGAAAGVAADGLGPAVAGAAAGPLAAQAHSSGSAALGPPSAAGPTPDAADAAQDPRLRPAPAGAPPQPPPRQQHAAMLMSSQQQPQQILQEQQQPQQQPAAGVLTSSAAAAVSGDASASDYIGVRPAPGGAGGWLAEASVLLGPAGQADPAGRRLRQAVPVGSELEAAFARDLALVWQEVWCGPSTKPPLCNFPFHRYCQDARLWAVFCEMPCWRDLAAYLAQLQEDGSLLRAAQAYDAGSLPQSWPELVAQLAGAAPPAAQHPASQRGDDDGRQGSGGSGPSHVASRAGSGNGDMGRGGAAAGRGSKRKADGPTAAPPQQEQPGQPVGSASGYPGVCRSKSGGWLGKVTLRGHRWRFELLRDHDARVVAVGRQLALFWASLASQGQHQPAPHPALRDSFLADAELVRQLEAAKDAIEMRRVVRELQSTGRLRQWRHLLPPPVTSGGHVLQRPQQTASAAAAKSGEESSTATGAAAGPAAAGRSRSTAALDALVALAATVGASEPPADTPPARAFMDGRLPPAEGLVDSQDASAAGAAAVPAAQPEGWEAQAAAWQQLSRRHAEAWAGSVQPAPMDAVAGDWWAQLAPDSSPTLRTAAPAPAAAAAEAAPARSSPLAEAATPRRSQQRLRPGSSGATGLAGGLQPVAGGAAAGMGQVLQGWQEQADAWQQVSQHAAQRWEASVPTVDPSWLTDNAQLQSMLLPGAGGPAAASSQQQAAAGEEAGGSPMQERPGWQAPPAATPAGCLLASLPAAAAARLQLLLARLPVEALPEGDEAVDGGGGGSLLHLSQQQLMQRAPQAAGGDVLLYCRKTNGLAGLPLLERLVVVEARREGGPSLGPKASQQHCECLLLASGPSEAHLSMPEPLLPGADSAAVAAALGRVALLSRTAFKLRDAAVRSARQWRLVGRVPRKPFTEVLAELAPRAQL